MEKNSPVLNEHIEETGLFNKRGATSKKDRKKNRVLRKREGSGNSNGKLWTKGKRSVREWGVRSGDQR